MLYLTFEEYAVNTITPDTTTQLSYFVDYYQDTTTTFRILVGIFIAATILAIIFAVIRICVWTRHNPKQVYISYKNNQELVDTSRWIRTIVLKTIFHVMNEWVKLIYWLCFFICGYYFIMYKM